MKKLFLLLVILLGMSTLTFSQNVTDPINGNMDLRSTPPQQNQQNYNYELQQQARHYRTKGITNMVCGGVWIGLGATCLAMQPNPYYYYDNSAYFWCGVTLVTCGGIEMLAGIIQVSHSAVILNKAKGITLTPSKRDVGFAINF